jgi:hypothetical protein
MLFNTFVVQEITRISIYPVILCGFELQERQEHEMFYSLFSRQYGL